MEVAELQVAHDGWPLLASLGLRSALLRRRRPRLKNPLLALDRTKRSLSLSLSCGGCRMYVWEKLIGNNEGTGGGRAVVWEWETRRSFFCLWSFVLLVGRGWFFLGLLLWLYLRLPLDILHLRGVRLVGRSCRKVHPQHVVAHLQNGGIE